MVNYVIATEFPTAEQKQNGEAGLPIAFRFGETYIALLKAEPPVKQGLQNWVLASAPSLDGPWEVLEDTFGKRMNHPLICLGRLAETAVNSKAATKKKATPSKVPENAVKIA